MSMWEHKLAQEIAGAVERHLQSANGGSQHGVLLVGVYKAAKRAAETAMTGPEDLRHIRSSLCFTCRGNKIYVCDVKEGWSPNCAFMKSNQ